MRMMKSGHRGRMCPVGERCFKAKRRSTIRRAGADLGKGRCVTLRGSLISVRAHLRLGAVHANYLRFSAVRGNLSAILCAVFEQFGRDVPVEANSQNN